MGSQRPGRGRLLQAMALAAIALGAGEPEVFIVALWANDDSVDALPNVVATGDHPCGAWAEVRLTVMPPYRRDGGALGTELVVESDEAGREVARWSVPLDYEPLAVNGSDMLLSLGSQRLWIGADGSLRREPQGRDYPAATAAQCPAGGPFEESAYAICARFTDVATGRPRLLRYEAPCT